jgi:hypothetical protein
MWLSRPLRLLSKAVAGAVLTPPLLLGVQPCSGLGGEGQPRLVAASFDVRQPARAYGVTADGQLLWLSLGHAKTFQNCQVRCKPTVLKDCAAGMAVSVPCSSSRHSPMEEQL